MSTGPSRRLRSVFGAFAAIPWRSLLLDMAFVVAWVGAVTVAFEATGLEQWLYYVVAFGGVIVYSLVVGPVLSRRVL
jgi:hypothetical protein